jgi:hypothetical protein
MVEEGGWRESLLRGRDVVVVLFPDRKKNEKENLCVLDIYDEQVRVSFGTCLSFIFGQS